MFSKIKPDTYFEELLSISFLLLFFCDIRWNKFFPETLVLFLVSRMISSYCRCLSFQISPSSSSLVSLISEEDGSRCSLNDEKWGHGFITAYAHYNMKNLDTSNICVVSANSCTLLKPLRACVSANIEVILPNVNLHALPCTSVSVLRWIGATACTFSCWHAELKTLTTLDFCSCDS